MTDLLSTLARTTFMAEEIANNDLCLKILTGEEGRPKKAQKRQGNPWVQCKEVSESLQNCLE